MTGRVFFHFLAVVILTASISYAADGLNATHVTQFDFASKLIDQFGWSEGLPENPAKKDYLAILKGSRSFRFEAEEVYDQQADKVSVRKYDLFGSFTGKGWVHGITVPTAVHFTVFIPLAGKYTLKAATKGDGQLWSVAGRAFKVNASDRFKELAVGQVFVPAGRLEFNAVIPANGGIDYIDFSAPSLASLEPVAGWDFAAPLTKGQIAEVRSALIGNEHLLPDDKSFAVKTISPAALNKLPPGVLVTDNLVYGKPLSPNWLRAGYAPASVVIPVEADAAGVYRVRIRYTGKSLAADFGSRTVLVEGRPFLDWVDLGTFRLKKALHTLKLHLPSRGGVDLVEITRKTSSASDYMALSGLTGNQNDKVSAAELDVIMKSLTESFKERR